MTRIIAGRAGGRRLRTPAGRSTRPTSDRVREALFSAIESYLGTLAGRRFLDVYAGSGAVGLEAASRGAAHVTLVEQDRSAAALIRANVKTLDLLGVSVVTGRAEALAEDPPEGGPYDVAFLDPPYDMPGSRPGQVAADLLRGGWLADDVLVIVERPRRGAEWAWPAGFRAIRARRYGETMLCYGRLG